MCPNDSAFGIRREIWERHSNPWSVWTRAATLPFVFLAVWSHGWLGWGFVLPLGLVAFWLWWNPRAFPPPNHTDCWASKATFGERVWAQRKKRGVSAEFNRVIWLTACIAGAGFLLGLWGCWRNELWPAFCGLCVSYLGKFWFLDRMVWLFELERQKDPELDAWIR